MKKSIISAVVAILLAGCSTGSEATEHNKSVAELEPNELQALFIDLSEDSTESDLEAWLTDHPDIYYSEESYNSDDSSTVYQLAFTDEDTEQSYKKSNGDYLRIDFLDSSESIKNAEYSTTGKPLAVFYSQGTYYAFSDNSSDDLTGFYLSGMPNDTEGITIKYTNGNEKQTSYIPYLDAETLLIAQRDYQEK